MIKVAVDAMGGDFAPRSVVDGVVQAVKKYDVFVYLVGQTARIQEELKVHKFDPSRIEIIQADEIVEMNESPAVAIRKKKNSSISVGIQLLKNGKADAFFCAGNTGGVVCAATLFLGLLETVERPGIAIVMPNLKGVSLLVDAGANIDPKPLHLLQYGIMGSAYFEQILGKKNPTVGLLNVGEEESKGTDFVKETYQMLEQSPVNFIGNVEGKDIFSGECDVIVCDGFVGNVTLKVAEALAETMAHLLRQQILSSVWGRLGYLFARSSLKNFKKKIDYSEYGGAPLLGVDGVVIIGHGRSSAKAVMNAIRFAKDEVERHINQDIIERMKKTLVKVSPA
ncbi:MAG: phosphate acyltransferase PlsX [Candidatus Omnitrophota bacterium]